MALTKIKGVVIDDETITTDNISDVTIDTADIKTSSIDVTSKLTGSVPTANLSNATASDKGISSFSSDNFAVSSGAVTIKDLGVATAEIQANAVTGAKFNADVISAQTELAVAPADTDEFLVSDAGVIKRIDYSLIKSTSFTSAVSFRAFANADQSISNETSTQINFAGEEYDVGSDFGSNQFTAPSDGKYFFYANIYMYAIGTKRFQVTFNHTILGDASYTGQQLWSGIGDVASGGGTSDQAQSVACIFSMTSGSTMRIFLYHNAGSSKSVAGVSNVNNTKTTFGGFQIG